MKKRTLTRENSDMAHKRKPTERNRISSHRSTNNAIKINYAEARIDEMKQKSRCRLCSDRDDTINHNITQCSKLAQREYK